MYISAAVLVPITVEGTPRDRQGECRSSPSDTLSGFTRSGFSMSGRRGNAGASGAAAVCGGSTRTSARTAAPARLPSAPTGETSARAAAVSGAGVSRTRPRVASERAGREELKARLQKATRFACRAANRAELFALVYTTWPPQKKLPF